MRRSVLKAILSTLLILTLLILVFSGTLLYFGKTGVVLGVPRYMLRGIHFCAAVLMCVCAAIHLILNRKAYKAELRACAKGSRNRSAG